MLVKFRCRDEFEMSRFEGVEVIKRVNDFFNSETMLLCSINLISLSLIIDN
jgi:hypothetical protein